jgi:hypothetical protein
MNPIGKNRVKWVLTLLAAMVIAGDCFGNVPIESTGPTKVKIQQLAGRWQLYVNQQPFFIKGAGLEFGDQEKLAAAGGNSFRTWRTDNGHESGRQILDRAQKNGLFVTMGLEMATERHGFDYANTNDVAKQLAGIKIQVLKYKDDPALLMWDIGNELNLNAHNPKVWDAVNDISKMIHQLDPNHPTTTSLAGINGDLVREIKTRAPDLDLLCIQSYADIVNLPRELRESGWHGPYVVTEWGATGHWECGKTSWGAPIEDNSSVKAGLYFKRYQAAIASDPAHCLGSYVFLWGQKQERTPTWYGVFLASGEATEAVDVMQRLWTGHWPEFRSPQMEGLWLDGKTADQNVHLKPGQGYPAKVQVQSPAGRSLACTWEIMKESDATTAGGDFEYAPEKLPGLVTAESAKAAQVHAPVQPGAYRLFAYVLNGHDRAAYANIPFYVDATPEKIAARP